mmetsp:Transcript_163213/g.313497  ORF Transcript_163213/g.313497 Transcript_163213/m.313497 type:complete len:112 (-) Transcript_163213:1568-1903(-)
MTSSSTSSGNPGGLAGATMEVNGNDGGAFGGGGHTFGSSAGTGAGALGGNNTLTADAEGGMGAGALGGNNTLTADAEGGTLHDATKPSGRVAQAEGADSQPHGATQRTRAA